MRYISTRGEAKALDFSDALLHGLASDGGLTMPESFPEFTAADIRAMRGLTYPEIALRVMAPSFQPGWDVLIIARPALVEADHDALVGALRRLLQRGGVIGGSTGG